MKSASFLTCLILSFSPVLAWELPPDNGTIGQQTIQEIIKGNDYPETTSYQQKIDYIDFVSNGQKFTQVVVILTPEKPLLRDGKKVTVVAGEPGS